MKETTLNPAYLAEAIWPRASAIRDVLFVICGSWFIAIMAQVQIPLFPVPITGQTFAVLLIGMLLGRTRGVLAVITYLGQGALGLPVFAGGAFGLVRFMGPTAGYLWGFILAAFVVGWLSEIGLDRRIITAIPVMIIGNLFIYGFGLVWLAQFAGWDNVIKVGMMPFLVGDSVKIVIAALALPIGWKLVNSRV